MSSSTRRNLIMRFFEVEARAEDKEDVLMEGIIHDEEEDEEENDWNDD